MKLVILGNGGYLKTLQDAAEQLGYEILADPLLPYSFPPYVIDWSQQHKVNG